VNRQTGKHTLAWVDIGLPLYRTVNAKVFNYLTGRPDPATGEYLSYIDKYARVSSVPGIPGCKRLFEAPALEFILKRNKLNRYFEGIMTYLCAHCGYEEDVDLFAYTYDWRQSPGHPTVHRGLDEALDRAMALTGGLKVDVIAHSLGCVVVDTYMRLYPDWHRKIRRYITLAAPNDGAGGFLLSAIVTGYALKLPLSSLNARAMQACGGSTVYLNNSPAGDGVIERVDTVDGGNIGDASSAEEAATPLVGARYVRRDTTSNPYICPLLYIKRKWAGRGERQAEGTEGTEGAKLAERTERTEAGESAPPDLHSLQGQPDSVPHVPPCRYDIRLNPAVYGTEVPDATYCILERLRDGIYSLTGNAAQVEDDLQRLVNGCRPGAATVQLTYWNPTAKPKMPRGASKRRQADAASDGQCAIISTAPLSGEGGEASGAPGANVPPPSSLPGAMVTKILTNTGKAWKNPVALFEKDFLAPANLPTLSDILAGPAPATGADCCHLTPSASAATLSGPTGLESRSVESWSGMLSSGAPSAPVSAPVSTTVSTTSLVREFESAMLPAETRDARPPRKARWSWPRFGRNWDWECFSSWGADGPIQCPIDLDPAHVRRSSVLSHPNLRVNTQTGALQVVNPEKLLPQRYLEAFLAGLRPAEDAAQTEGQGSSQRQDQGVDVSRINPDFFTGDESWKACPRIRDIVIFQTVLKEVCTRSEPLPDYVSVAGKAVRFGKVVRRVLRHNRRSQEAPGATSVAAASANGASGNGASGNGAPGNGASVSSTTIAPLPPKAAETEDSGDVPSGAHRTKSVRRARPHAAQQAAIPRVSSTDTWNTHELVSSSSDSSTGPEGDENVDGPGAYEDGESGDGTDGMDGAEGAEASMNRFSRAAERLDGGEKQGAKARKLTRRFSKLRARMPLAPWANPASLSSLPQQSFLGLLSHIVGSGTLNALMFEPHLPYWEDSLRVKTRQIGYPEFCPSATPDDPEYYRFLSIQGHGFDTPLHTVYSKPIDDYSELQDQQPNFLFVDGDSTVCLYSALSDGTPDCFVEDRVVLAGASHFKMLHDARVWKLIGDFLRPETAKPIGDPHPDTSSEAASRPPSQP